MQKTQFQRTFRVMEGLFLADWAIVKDKKFMDAHSVTAIIHPPCLQLPCDLSQKISTFEFLWNIDETKFSPILANHQCSFFDSVLEEKNNIAETVLVCDYGLTADALSISCILLMFKFKWTLIKTLFLLQKAFPLMRALPINTNSLILYDRFISSFSERSKSLFSKKDTEISENALVAKNTFLNFSVKKKQQIRFSKSETKGKEVNFNISSNMILPSQKNSSLPTQFSKRQRKQQILTIDSEPKKLRQISMIIGKSESRMRAKSSQSKTKKSRMFKSNNEKRSEFFQVKRYQVKKTECFQENQTLRTIQNKIREKFSFTTFVHSNKKKLHANVRK